jgi:hypothetical protein
MSNYTIEKIENGIATIRYPDQSWAEVVLKADMTEDELDALAWDFKPKIGASPVSINLTVGQTRTASPLPAPLETHDGNYTDPEWYTNRVDAYGSLASQIEYITENGLEAWQAHVAEIKALYPKI